MKIIGVTLQARDTHSVSVHDLLNVFSSSLLARNESCMLACTLLKVQTILREEEREKTFFRFIAVDSDLHMASFMGYNKSR